jgi:outer membrane protein assembly factor BamB
MTRGRGGDKFLRNTEAFLKKYDRYGAFVVLNLFLWLIHIPGLMAQSVGTQDNGELSLITKRAIWQQPLGGAVMGTPSTQVESVVVVCDGGTLKAYTRQGVPLWDYFAGESLTPFLTRSRDGTSYIGSTTGTFIAVNRTGRELWRIKLGAPLARPVLVGWDGRLFVATEKKIVCYNATGYLLWYKHLEHPVALSLRADKQGGFIAVLAQGELLHINPFGKTQSHQLGSVPVAIVPLMVSALESATGNTPEQDYPLLILYKDGTTELLSSRYPPAPTLPGIPLAAASLDDKVAIVLADGQVLCLSITQGQILWIKESQVTPGAVSADLIEETGVLYDERGIVMLSQAGAAGFTEDGQRRWFVKLTGAASMSAFSDESLLYSGGKDWNLYAYRLENRIRFQKKNFYGPAPEGTYGLGDPLPMQRTDYYNRFNETGLKAQFSIINRCIQEGRVGTEEKPFVMYLMEVAGSVRNSLKAANVRPPVHFPQRVEAVRLLSYLGSRELLPFLADLFINDPEPLVKVAAAEAIGRIGVDPDGIVLKAFANALFPPKSQVKDERVLIAVTASLGSLCRFSGPPVSDTGVFLLTVLGGREKPLRVRNRAQQELLSLHP